jgi:hypothetical protein
LFYKNRYAAPVFPYVLVLKNIKKPVLTGKRNTRARSLSVFYAKEIIASVSAKKSLENHLTKNGRNQGQRLLSLMSPQRAHKKKNALAGRNMAQIIVDSHMSHFCTTLQVSP